MTNIKNPLETYKILSETFTDEEIDAIVNDKVISEEFIHKIGKYVLGKLRNQNLINNMRYHSGWWSRHKAGLHNTLHHQYASYAARRERDRAFYAGKLGAQAKINAKSEWMDNYREAMFKADQDAKKAEGHARHHLDKAIEAKYISTQWKNAAINREQDDEALEVPARFVKGYMTGEPYSPNASKVHIDYSMLPGHVNRPAAIKPGKYRPGIKVKQKRRKGTEQDIADELHKNSPIDNEPTEMKQQRKINENVISDIISKVKNRKKISVQQKIEDEFGKVSWDSPKSRANKVLTPDLPSNDKSEFVARRRRIENKPNVRDSLTVIHNESIEIDYE